MKREKSADCLRSQQQHGKSSDNIRKLSNTSIPGSRITKKSCESLTTISRESTAENLRNQSTTGSLESCSSDPGESTTGILRKPSGLKKPTSGLSPPKKFSAPAPSMTSLSDSKIKQPVSGLARPSAGKSSMIGKPGPAARQSAITPPKLNVEETLTEPKTKSPPQGPPQTSRLLSPATTQKIPLPNGPSRRASDGTLGLATKSRLEASSLQKKKCSDITALHEAINENIEFKASSEPVKELQNPTIGRMPDRFEAQNTNKLINRPMKFQPNTNNLKQLVTETSKVENIEKSSGENEDDTANEVAAESQLANDISADEEELANQNDCDEDDSDVFEEASSILEADPFAEFDTKIDPSLLTGVNEDLSIKYTIDKTQDKVHIVDSHESEDEEPDYNSGYAEPEDSIKRSEQLSSDSGYIEPLDTLSSSHNSIANSYRQQVSNASSYIDETSSSNDSNPSPRFGESEKSPSPCLQENKTNEDCNTTHTSPFKRVQPKVMIPPPRLNSYTEDLLAPLHKDYMRTPSSDMEDFHILHHSQADGELRRKVREKALKVWGKKTPRSNEGEDDDDGALRESDEDDENTLGGDSDVFYSKECEQKSSKFFFYYYLLELNLSSMPLYYSFVNASKPPPPRIKID